MTSYSALYLVCSSIKEQKSSLKQLENLCSSFMLWRLFPTQAKFSSHKCRLLPIHFSPQYLKCFLLIQMLGKILCKDIICLNPRWNHIHFLCFPFLCKTLVILCARLSTGIDLGHSEPGCVCTLSNTNVAMIPAGIFIFIPWSYSSVIQGRTMCQDVPSDWQGGSLRGTQRAL